MKVLFVDSPLDPPGGGQISLMTLILGVLEKYKNDVEICVALERGGKFLEYLRRMKVETEVVPIWKIPLKIFKLKPDIVHCNSATTKYTFLTALFSKFFGVRFIWHNRVVDSAGTKDKVIAFLSDRIVVVSDFVARKFAGFESKTVKIPNAVDTQIFKPLAKDKELVRKLGLDGHVVGVFSRIERRKGHHLLVKALTHVRKKFTLLLVGDGPEKDSILSLAKKLGIKTSWVGFVDFDELPKFINLCDIVVNPSVEPESFGRVIIEAMACGKPVVSTNLGGPCEIIDDGVDGFLVNPDEIELSKAIGKLLSSQKLRDKLGKRARQKALKKYSLNIQIERIVKLWREISNP